MLDDFSPIIVSCVSQAGIGPCSTDCPEERLYPLLYMGSSDDQCEDEKLVCTGLSSTLQKADDLLVLYTILLLLIMLLSLDKM
jgi:hypothetical protein